MKTNLEKHKHYQKKSRYQFCEIPNDEEGQQLVKLMKKYLNKHRYKIRVKGQYLDKVKYPDTYWSKGAPIDACTHIRVYIDERPEVLHNQWTDTITYGLRHAIHTLEHRLAQHESLRK
jgi:hypothetical protein|tara:strand:- start:75 stop:428 length:354 start_codon:yes stop_codon:yes gene_type:complete